MSVVQGDVPIALTCKNYIIAMQQREPHNQGRIAKVAHVPIYCIMSWGAASVITKLPSVLDIAQRHASSRCWACLA